MLIFQPNEEPKVEYNPIIQKTRNVQKHKDTTVIKVTLSKQRGFLRHKSSSLINDNTK